MSEKEIVEVVKKAPAKSVIILSAIIGVLVIGLVVTAVLFLLNPGGSADDGRTPDITIGYEQNGVVAIKPDDINAIFGQMVDEAQDGMMDLSYKHIALSADGVNFVCSLGNSASNKYDMYMNLYLDNSLEQQLLLTGLIPPGSKIEEFESEIPLDPGTYDAILVFTQVASDHATIKGQVMVVLHLVVTDGDDEIVIDGSFDLDNYGSDDDSGESDE